MSRPTQVKLPGLAGLDIASKVVEATPPPLPLGVELEASTAESRHQKESLKSPIVIVEEDPKPAASPWDLPSEETLEFIPETPKDLEPRSELDDLRSSSSKNGATTASSQTPRPSDSLENAPKRKKSSKPSNSQSTRGQKTQKPKRPPTPSRYLIVYAEQILGTFSCPSRTPVKRVTESVAQALNHKHPNYDAEKVELFKLTPVEFKFDQLDQIPGLDQFDWL